MSQPKSVTGRCYCGAVTFEATDPLTVVYCHCADCRRWTGAPLPAFAGFKTDVFRTTPELGQGRSFAKGVRRWNCPACGSPLAASFDYIEGQIYVPLGVIDQAEDLPPTLHCHGGAQMPWLHLDDGLPREAGTARDTLLGANK